MYVLQILSYSKLFIPFCIYHVTLIMFICLIVKPWPQTLSPKAP